MKNTIYLTLLLFITLSCASDKQFYLYEDIVIDKESFNCEEDGPCATAYYSYPKFIDSIKTRDLSIFINANLTNAHKAESVEKSAEIFIEEYEKFIADFPEFPGNKWDINSKATIVLNTESIVSIKIDSRGYTGGAHGFRRVDYLNYNMTEQKAIALSDLIINLDEFNTKAREAFFNEYNIDSDISLSEQGYNFEKGYFRVNNNFSLGQDSITIHFNQYEIAPYSMGDFTIELAYEEFKNNIKMEYYPLLNLN